ncbi:hypothetical protein AVEN_261204-1, partial [Araneus ventricosus]
MELGLEVSTLQSWSLDIATLPPRQGGFSMGLGLEISTLQSWSRDT